MMLWNVVLEKTLESPLTARRSNQSILKEINPEYSLKVKVIQSCLTLWDPMDYTIYGILQARMLEWVAFPFCRGSSQPRDRTQVSCIAGRFFTSWATREAPFIEGIDAKTEAPILCLPDTKNSLIGKDWCCERLKAEGEEGGRGWDG